MNRINLYMGNFIVKSIGITIKDEVRAFSICGGISNSRIKNIFSKSSLMFIQFEMLN